MTALDRLMITASSGGVLETGGKNRDNFHYPPRVGGGRGPAFAEVRMLYRYYRRLRRLVRGWRLEAIRSERIAVIQRVVAAAARDSQDLAARTDSKPRSTVKPPATPTPLTAQLLGLDPSESAIPAEEIGQRARQIWERNGRPMGTAAQDWAQAEAELRAERRTSS